jgi:flagellar hook-length control protein FliK
MQDPGASEAVYGSHAAPHISSIPVAGPIQIARLMEGAGQTEMRIGLNTSAFGNVQVRTVVRASEVGVQIGSEKGDLRSLLATDIPGIAHSLQQQDLRLTQVSFQQHGFSYSGDSAQHNSQSRPFVYKQNSAAASSVELSPAETELLPNVRNNAESGLSILA